MTLSARYENGVFRPLEDVKIQEGTVVEVYVPPGKEAKPSSIGDLGFAGMWTTREDISDGITYVNRIRDNPRM